MASIGAIGVLALTAAWLLTGLAFVGSEMFFYASVLPIRVTLKGVGAETDYLARYNPPACSLPVCRQVQLFY